MYFPTVNLSQKTVLQILSISEGHGAIMLKPCFLNVHWEIIFMNAVFMTGRKRMHGIPYCMQNIEITPHPAQTQHPITVSETMISTVLAADAPLIHTGQNMSVNWMPYRQNIFPGSMYSPVQITGIHDILTDGCCSPGSNHRCTKLRNSLQIIIVFFSEKW